MFLDASEKKEVDTRIKSTRTSSPVVNRKEFPSMLAWGSKVLNIQDLSLKEKVVSFELLKHKKINYGQIYVALSSVTTLTSLLNCCLTECMLNAN